MVFASATDKYPQDWSRDGSFIVFMTPGSKSGTALYRLPLTGKRKPELLIENGSDIDEARLSPDGRWIAYDSNESGRWETYVASFPGFTQQRQVSSAAGGQALWRKDSKELFYLSLDAKIMAVDVKAGSTIETGMPHMLGGKRVLGPENLDTLRSMQALAAVFDSLGKFVQAEALLNHVVNARLHILGKNDAGRAADT